MKAIYPFQKSPRCTAMSKRSRKPCQAPAVRGWTVCRFHGAPKGVRNGAYKDGLHTKEAVEDRRKVQKLLRKVRENIANIL